MEIDEIRPFRAGERDRVCRFVASAGPDGSPPHGPAWIEDGLRSGEVLVATAGDRVVGVAAWSPTATWRRDTVRRAAGRRRTRRRPPSSMGAPAWAPSTSPAWDRRAADLAARRRWLDTDPDLGRLLGLVVEGPLTQDDGRLLAAVVEAARARGIRRLDARLHPRDPLAAHLVAAGWMAGMAHHHLTCSTLVSLPWRQGDAAPPHRSRLVRSLAAVRWGRVPALAAMAAEEGWGTIRAGTGTAPRASGAADGVRGWHPYEAVRYRTVRRALALIPAPLRRGAFVDVGCGRGRVLTLASRLSFSRLIGVELDPGLATDARRLNADPRVEVVDADATTWALPDDVGVIYLFNPFGPDGLASVARNVQASLARRPRPLLVLLANPRDLEALLDVGLEVVHAEPLSALLATGPRPPAHPSR